MGDNNEPKTEFLRLRDVLAWLPRVTLQQLQQLEAAGTIKPFVRAPGCRRFYHKSELKRVFRV